MFELSGKRNDIRRQLSHIYYYYTHAPPSGRYSFFASGVVLLYTLTLYCRKAVTVKLLFDGVDLRDVESLEHEYLRVAHEEMIEPFEQTLAVRYHPVSSSHAPLETVVYVWPRVV